TKLVGLVKLSAEAKALVFKHGVQGLSFSTKLKF
ncbi:MAG: hypothetical protein ACI81P_000599, partial [Neolewinella sp.]